FGLCLPRHRPDSWRYLHGHHALRRQRWVRGCLRPAQDHRSEGVMARRRFGVDLTSLVWTTTDIDDNLDVVKLVRHADNITVWNDREGGEQITDLTSLNGTPLTDGVVQSDEHGMFAFYGPDTDPPTVEVWIDAGLGARQLAVATDLGPEFVSFSSRIDEVEDAIGDLKGSDLVAELLEEDPFYIAHRGSGNDHPEHTLEAYRAAVAAGAKAIEVSVLITADGALVCGHDFTTDRTTGKAGVVRELHASGLLGYPVDMREWLGPSWGTQRWPYLDEVLDEFGGRVVIFLEPKHPEAAIPCINEISRRGLQNSVVYKSHRWGTFQAIAKAEGFRVWSYLDSDTPLAEAKSIAEEADFLGLPIRDDVSSMPDTPDTLIEDVVAIGKPVIVWPVSRRSAVERVTNLGVQGIMASSWIYLSRSTPVLSRDTFASGTRAPGDTPRTMVPSYQPSWDDGAIVLDHPSQQSYMLGSLCPVEADEYRIRFDLAYDSVPADGNRHSGLVFGRENDT